MKHTDEEHGRRAWTKRMGEGHGGRRARTKTTKTSPSHEDEKSSERRRVAAG
eukprot:CAMPEP_0201892160 /NCGR_PEP_ID=MMETSP0902-20130614/35905_1 /ASSEMBLY_ACC=CAM_ASM_000551 /TAXON_ID=420261 /ORGANISM="Thalassiosira antarctica, Strain CCMP982" /LENGTH=51 /DNA_ID=CAMNT_0048423551 /DNA_START=334 /DNA_END=486 /DNA_ORIENTATION=+